MARATPEFAVALFKQTYAALHNGRIHKQAKFSKLYVRTTGLFYCGKEGGR